ncbi:MAG: hypothetical protein J5574_02105 [Lachnospiraceae bacterium]|nr:hypothetical protein [Lachnospiraceae bacterium]
MFDITSMLGSTGSNSNSGNSMGSFDFANYAAIKNGSYGKLVKSYYAGTDKAVNDEKAAATKAASSTKTKAKEEVDKTGLTQIKKDADQLKTSVEDLGKEDLWKKTEGKVDTDKLLTAVKGFADNYNKVIDQASKVSSKEISQDVKFMTGMTDTFNKVLAKAGINVGDDGKLSVNEEAFKKADEATLKSLFSGNGTYGSQIADKANSIVRDADLGTSIYGSNAETSSALSSLYNQLI